MAELRQMADQQAGDDLMTRRTADFSNSKQPSEMVTHDRVNGSAPTTKEDGTV